MRTMTALQRRIDNVGGFSFKVPQHYLPELVQPIGGVDTIPAAQVRRLLLLVAVLLVFAVVWAAFSRIERVSVANGVIEPIELERPVEAAETARISRVLIRPGQAVQAGDPMIVLDSAGTLEDLALAQANFAAATASKDELREGESRSAFDQAQADAAVARLRQRAAEVDVINAQIGTAQRALAIASDDLARSRRLFAQKAVTQTTLNQRENIANEAAGRLELLVRQKTAFLAARGEAQSDLTAIGKQQQIALQERRRDATVQLAQARSALARAKQRVDALVIRSPVNGFVKDVAVTPGRIVAGGAPLAVVTPNGGHLAANLLLPARAAAGVRIGSQVRLQPQSDHGPEIWLKGKVQHISPSSFQNTDGTRYFKVRVDVTPGTSAALAEVHAGMEVSGRIKVGNASVLEHLLSPIRRGFRQTFEEH